MSAPKKVLLWNELIHRLDRERDPGATSEYPATHALLKSTATVVRGPQSASKVIYMY